MSTVEEIEHAVEQLPPKEFATLAVWFEGRRQQLARLECSNNVQEHGVSSQGQMILRDHGAFLSSYAPQDEGLYDDAAAG